MRLKFLAARRADVMGLPKLPEACGFRGQYRDGRGGKMRFTPRIATFLMVGMMESSSIVLCWIYDSMSR